MCPLWMPHTQPPSRDYVLRSHMAPNSQDIYLRGELNVLSRQEDIVYGCNQWKEKYDMSNTSFLLSQRSAVCQPDVSVIKTNITQKSKVPSNLCPEMTFVNWLQSDTYKQKYTTESETQNEKGISLNDTLLQEHSSYKVAKDITTEQFIKSNCVEDYMRDSKIMDSTLSDGQIHLLEEERSETQIVDLNSKFVRGSGYPKQSKEVLFKNDPDLTAEDLFDGRLKTQITEKDLLLPHQRRIVHGTEYSLHSQLEATNNDFNPSKYFPSPEKTMPLGKGQSEDSPPLDLSPGTESYTLLNIDTSEATVLESECLLHDEESLYFDSLKYSKNDNIYVDNEEDPSLRSKDQSLFNTDSDTKVSKFSAALTYDSKQDMQFPAKLQSGEATSVAPQDFARQTRNISQGNIFGLPLVTVKTSRSCEDLYNKTAISHNKTNPVESFSTNTTPISATSRKLQIIEVASANDRYGKQESVNVPATKKKKVPTATLR